MGRLWSRLNDTMKLAYLENPQFDTRIWDISHIKYKNISLQNYVRATESYIPNSKNLLFRKVYRTNWWLLQSTRPILMSLSYVTLLTFELSLIGR